MLFFVMAQGFQRKPRRCSLLCLKSRLGFCSDSAASPISVPSVRSPKSEPMLLAKTISAEQCKTEPEWVVAGKPPQALEPRTMCSCPPSQGGSSEKSF